MTQIRFEPKSELDIISVEREARALRAKVMADAFRAFGVWVRTRLARAPQGRTA